MVGIGQTSSFILLSGLTSKVLPLVRLRKGILELVMDEKLKKPLLKVGGKKVEEIYTILAGKFLTRENNGHSEVLIPLTALPAVSVWLLASYTSKPSRDLLEELLCRTPKVIADLFWDLVELSESFYDGKDSEKGKPFIDHRIALKASKVVRALLELYKLRW
jgi:hypothetical protein